MLPKNADDATMNTSATFYFVIRFLDFKKGRQLQIPHYMSISITTALHGQCNED